MNVEAARLRSFERWPSITSSDARRIAKAGFFYVGEGVEVQCFSCGTKVSEQDFSDDLDVKHRTLNPDCMFLSNPDASGNFPLASSSSQEDPSDSQSSSNSSSLNDASSNSSAEDHPAVRYYAIESTRLETFEDWPVPSIVSPEALARAGFYYVKKGDVVRCAFCQGLVFKWEAGDDPIREHRKHFPSCRFLNSLSASSSMESTDCPPGVDIREEHKESSSESASLRELGVQSHKVPKHPNYATVESRLRTYTHWPRKQWLKPENLAEAGFFYLGCDDHVRCFHCDGGLKLWDPTDDPWKEHARWFADCGFILLVKGEQFVKEATAAKPPSYPSNLSMLFEKDRKKVEKRLKAFQLKNGTAASSRPPREPLYRVTAEEMRALLDSPQARAAIQLGIDSSRVKMAIKEKVERTGTNYSSTDAIATAALNLQCEEAATSEIEEMWTTPPESPMMTWIQTLGSAAARSQRESTPPEHDISSTSSSSSLDSRQENDNPSTVSSSSSSASGPSEDYQRLSDRLQTSVDPQTSAFPLRSTSGAEGSSSTHCIKPSEESNSDDQCRTVSLEEENRQLKEARLCKICMDNEVMIVFLPCGHLVTCASCAISLPACPVCRQPIKATVKTFLS